MPFPEFDPVIFQIGPVALRWYALAYVAGILLGWRYGLMLAKNTRLWGERGPPITPEQIDDLILWITLGIILGGRIGYVLFYQPQLITKDPLAMLRIWEGGMSFHGGLIGVTIALLIFARANKINLLRLADITAPCVPFGLFFGRVANFVNGELWGRTTELPWGVVFCNQYIEAAARDGVCPAGPLPRHPSQLYEAALEGIVLFLILRFATHRLGLLKRPGAVTGLFLLFYGLFRFLMEFVREPDLHMPEYLRAYLTMGMLLSIPMVLAGLYLMLRARRRAEAEPAQA